MTQVRLRTVDELYGLFKYVIATRNFANYQQITEWAFNNGCYFLVDNASWDSVTDRWRTNTSSHFAVENKFYIFVATDSDETALMAALQWN